MMFRDGVFVPPGCTTHKNGYLPDLRATPFVLRIVNFPPDEGKLPTETEISIGFGEPDELCHYPNSVESEPLVVPFDSGLATRARQIAEMDQEGYKIRAATYNPSILAIRDAFCDRVAQCHGVINGKCWSLSSDAVREVIEEA